MKFRITAEIFCLVGLFLLVGYYGSGMLGVMGHDSPALGLVVVTIGQALQFEVPFALLVVIHILVLLYCVVYMSFLHLNCVYHPVGYGWGMIVSALVITLFDLFPLVALLKQPVIEVGSVVLLVFAGLGLVASLVGGILVMFVKEQFADANEEQIGFVDYDEMARKYRVDVTLAVDPIFKSNLEVKMDNKIITPKEYCDMIKHELRKNNTDED